jgi:hypothetical protein
MGSDPPRVPPAVTVVITKSHSDHRASTQGRLHSRILPRRVPHSVTPVGAPQAQYTSRLWRHLGPSNICVSPEGRSSAHSRSLLLLPSPPSHGKTTVHHPQGHSPCHLGVVHSIHCANSSVLSIVRWIDPSNQQASALSHATSAPFDFRRRVFSLWTRAQLLPPPPNSNFDHPFSSLWPRSP